MSPCSSLFGQALQGIDSAERLAQPNHRHKDGHSQNEQAPEIEPNRGEKHVRDGKAQGSAETTDNCQAGATLAVYRKADDFTDSVACTGSYEKAKKEHERQGD